MGKGPERALVDWSVRPLPALMGMPCEGSLAKRPGRNERKCKRIANVSCVTSRQRAAPNDIEANPKLHVSAPFGTRRQPASGH